VDNIKDNINIMGIDKFTRLDRYLRQDKLVKHDIIFYMGKLYELDIFSFYDIKDIMVIHHIF
jgi:hypothetical protein